MKPFAYNGAFESYEDLQDIINIFTLCIDVIISKERLKNLKFIMSSHNINGLLLDIND